MIRLFALFIVPLFIINYNAIGQKLVIQRKPNINAIRNALVIEGRCAIIVRPNDKKIKLMKKGISDSDYMTIISDNQYYLGEAINFLDSIKVRQIEKLSNGVLNFRSNSGQYFKMPLGSFDWGIILFNGRTKPISVEMTNLEEEYQDYMRK